MGFLNMFTRRKGLNALGSLNDHMLDDLGLCRHDVLEASKFGAAKNLLDIRRSERSKSR